MQVTKLSIVLASESDWLAWNIQGERERSEILPTPWWQRPRKAELFPLSSGCKGGGRASW